MCLKPLRRMTAQQGKSDGGIFFLQKTGGFINNGEIVKIDIITDPSYCYVAGLGRGNRFCDLFAESCRYDMDVAVKGFAVACKLRASGKNQS